MEIGLYWSHLWSKRSLVSIYKVYLTRGFNFASLIKPTCEIYFIYTYSFPFRPFVSHIKADLHAVKVHYFWCIFTSFSQERERLTIAVVHRESTKKHNFYSNKTQKVVGSIHMKEVYWFVMYNHSKHAQDCKEMPYQKPFLKTTIFCFPCLLKEASTLGQKRNIFCQKSLFSSIWYHFKPFSRKISKFLDFKIDFLDKNVFVPQCEKRNTCSDSQEKKKLLRERNSLT